MGRKIDPKYVKALQEGETKAFSEIYEFYKQPLFYFILSKVKNTSDAEEVLQETFIKVYRHIHSLKSTDSFHGWIFSIAYNEANRSFTKKRDLTSDDEDYNIEEAVIANDNPSSDIYKKEVLIAITEELAKLSPKYRETAELRYLAGLSIKEIAQQLDVAPGVIKSRLYNVRTTVKPRLKERGYETRYFSFAGIPLLLLLMRQVWKNNTVSKNCTNELYQKLDIEESSTTPKFHHSLLNSSLIKIVLAVIVFSISLTLILRMDLPDNQIRNYIQFGDNSIDTIIEKYRNGERDGFGDITYDQNPTRESVRVEIALTKKLEKQDIKILYAKTEQEFEIRNNQLIFYAQENGEYVVETSNWKEQIVISNIDPYTPEVKDALKYKDKVVFSILDEQNKIDYKNSYFEYKNQTYTFTSSHQIDGYFDGIAKLIIVDSTGQRKEYNFDFSLQ